MFKLFFILCLTVFVVKPATSKTLIISRSTINQSALSLQQICHQKIVRVAFNILNINLKIINLPASRALHALNKGETDGDFLRIAEATIDFSNTLIVPEPISSIKLVAFTRNENIRLPHSWDSLNQYSVAFIRGWKGVEHMLSYHRHKTAVDNSATLFKLLARVDIILFSKEFGLGIIKSNQLEGVTLLSPVLEEKTLHFILHKKHRHLVTPLSQAIIEAKTALGKGCVNLSIQL